MTIAILELTSAKSMTDLDFCQSGQISGGIIGTLGITIGIQKDKYYITNNNLSGYATGVGSTSIIATEDSQVTLNLGK